MRRPSDLRRDSIKLAPLSPLNTGVEWTPSIQRNLQFFSSMWICVLILGVCLLFGFLISVAKLLFPSPSLSRPSLYPPMPALFPFHQYPPPNQCHCLSLHYHTSWATSYSCIYSMVVHSFNQQLSSTHISCYCRHWCLIFCNVTVGFLKPFILWKS